ncbi:hypothetical protein BTJ39_04785 [Izhakiella australiensis]|uniref:EAL domain-containing protein n=1 Tax=Izhakiella australiensis TaxID=1926881 RepID=A0A1S8YRN9_9GAMM|nr:sensor domain-containing phosphodiesterase [Izhakiella australiensis]OON41283.1 hypothetical protein BTJ39_04785 [Izhakiella australiensis]
MQLHEEAEPVQPFAIKMLTTEDRVRDHYLARFTDLTSQQLGMPYSYVTFIADDKQYVKSHDSLLPAETPVEEAFCRLTVEQGALLICEDTLEDSRFNHLRYVVEAPHFRFYAGIPLYGRDGTILGSLCVADLVPRQLTDIQQDVLAKIAQLVEAYLDARHAVGLFDAVTLLPNRQHLIEDLNTLPREDGRTGLVLIDCLNLSYTYQMACALGMVAVENQLKDLTQLLQTQLPLQDATLYCVALGRFALYLPEERLHGLLEVLDGDAENLHTRMSKHVRVTVQCHAGVTWFRGGDDAQETLRRAVSALHDAINYRQPLCLYDSFTDQIKKDDFQLLNDLGRQLAQGPGLHLVYQPKLSLHDGTITGVEALLRWNHPVLGEVSPARFIPLAEKTTLMPAISDWVINQAIQQLANWRQQNIALPLSVNISVSDLGRANFADRLIAALARHGLSPQDIELECLETERLLEMPEAMGCLSQLRKLGMRLFLDDFGSGYSNLNYLQQVPLDVIKLDRSLLKDITCSQVSCVIVRHLILMLKELSYQVVAEGVEDQTTAGMLQSLGCDEIQGFWFARPLSPEDLIHFICNHSAQDMLQQLDQQQS